MNRSETFAQDVYTLDPGARLAGVRAPARQRARQGVVDVRVRKDATCQPRPARLHVGDRIDDRLNVVRPGNRHRADRLAGGRIKQLELSGGCGGPNGVQTYALPACRGRRADRAGARELRGRLFSTCMFQQR
jgi:hypothetical protein